MHVERSVSTASECYTYATLTEQVIMTCQDDGLRSSTDLAHPGSSSLEISFSPTASGFATATDQRNRIEVSILVHSH